MTKVEILDDGDFSANRVAYLPPVIRGLKAWHFLGGSRALSERNLAPGGADAPAVVIGAPTVEASHLHLGSAGYLRTSVIDAVDDEEGTLLVVAKMPTGWSFSAPLASGFMVSSYNSDGKNMLLRKSGSFAEPVAVPRAVMYRDIAGTPTYQSLDGTAVTDASQWQFYSRKANASSASLTNKTTGVVNTSATAGALIGSGVPYLIGSSPGGIVDPIDVAFAAFYDVALTADEEDEIYRAVQEHMSDFSFAI